MIPDSTDEALWEFKDVKKLSNTRQLQSMASVANEEGLPLNIVMSETTQSISRPLMSSVTQTGGGVYIWDAESGTLTIWGQ